MARLACLTLVAALAYGAGGWPGPAQAQVHAASVNSHFNVYLPGVATGKELWDASEREVFSLINQHRQAAGCPSVVPDTALTIASKKHSQEMADHNYVSHTGLDGSTFAQRASAASYGFSASGEIISAGYADARLVIDGWMNSQGHREIILQCSNQDIGIGAVSAPGSQWGYYWTVLFGQH